MRITHNQLRRLIRETLEEMEPMMTAPTPSGRPAHAEPGNDGVSLLYLSLRGNMPEFYLNDVLIDPPPVDVDMMSDSPGTLQNDLLDWARQNGVTHIKDDDLVELDLVDDGKIFSIDEYSFFLHQHNM
jgi:hypothetical protein